MAKHIANILTACRIPGSILLLFFPAFSAEFYVIYLLCGFSDMIDGTIARKTNSAGKLGIRLDSAADLIFAGAAFIKLLPAIRLPGWLWIWSGAIAMIKLANIIWVFLSKKQFLAVHTLMNKAAGLLLFLLPLTISFAEPKYTAIVVCAVATVAAVREGVYVLTDRACL